ncbi:alpha-L-fucosidase [Sphingobium sp. R-21]|uniref:alpha-L-fucosidase n=1 Tax=Sphingobium sp. R-21 TaxID=3404056 RepID=UPI003CECAF02
MMSASAPAATFQPNWTSLVEGWETPQWFRDAKFGIWAHWGPQCQPEAGDWYGRLMYLPGSGTYQHHLSNYGHPADTGFMEIINRWKAEAWDPAALLKRYKQVGARYFMAMAGHHDNFDLYDSSHHSWNATRVGPKRDIVAGWEKAARAEGLPFGVSNHIAHAWHWYQPAYGYDPEGPRAGQRYDAFRLRKEDGQGKWWEGLDPQELYVGPAFVAPDGIASNKAMESWHDVHDGRWLEQAAAKNPAFVRNWLLRQNELVDRYKPDMVYFDNTRIPFGSVGLEAVAHYYNRAIEWHGSPNVVLTSKILTDYMQGGLMNDVERGFSPVMREQPWQTCTCIGDWHYNRGRFDHKSYVPAQKVIQRLSDIVSKNGNLLLSVPVRGDGTIDSEEEKILDGIAAWLKVNGDAAIFGSRPWRSFGEGPTSVPGGRMDEGSASDFTERDVRFTTNKGALYAIMLLWPTGTARIESLGRRALGGATIAKAELVGGGKLAWKQNDDALEINFPKPARGQMAPVVKLQGAGLLSAS